MATDERFNWQPLIEDLEARKATALEMGGAERVQRQRDLGKLPVRERLDLLLDPGSFVEYGQLADHMDPGYGQRVHLRPTAASLASVRSMVGGLQSAPTTSRSWRVRWEQ